MSTPSMLLLCGGAAASLAGVWSLAGLSERSTLRQTPRAVAASVVGLLGVGAIYVRAPRELRAELALPALFGVAGVLALAAGAAKLDAALRDKDGPRATRRTAGLIAGIFLVMAAVAAVSLELLLSSPAHARFGWSYMLPLVASALAVFAQRARLAGAGALALGRRGLFVGLAGVVLLAGARWSITPQPVRAAQVAPATAPSSAPEPPPAPAPEATVATPPPAEPSASALTSASALASASSAPATAPVAPVVAGELQIETVVSHGLLEADARGGVTRRLDRLQACLADPKNQQGGALSLKVGIDASGSVGYVKPLGGELAGTPLGACLLPAFYKMGFAAPPSNSAYFEITLRAPPR